MIWSWGEPLFYIVIFFKRKNSLTSLLQYCPLEQGAFVQQKPSIGLQPFLQSWSHDVAHPTPHVPDEHAIKFKKKTNRWKDQDKTKLDSVIKIALDWKEILNIYRFKSHLIKSAVGDTPMGEWLDIRVDHGDVPCLSLELVWTIVLSPRSLLFAAAIRSRGVVSFFRHARGICFFFKVSFF